MSGIFNLDAPIWVFMGEVADVIILSLLWWLCCLGVVTIGAANTAMYYVLGKKARKESTYVAKDFFKSFRQNFRQSVPISLITIIGTVSLVLYGTFIIQAVYNPSEAESLKFVLPITILFAFEFLSFNAYVWALLSRFEMPSRNLIKTALVMLHKHLLTTIVNLGVIVGVCFLIYKCPMLIIVAPGLIMLVQSYLLQAVFTGYIVAAQEAEENKDLEAEENTQVAEEAIEQL